MDVGDLEAFAPELADALRKAPTEYITYVCVYGRGLKQKIELVVHLMHNDTFSRMLYMSDV